MINELSNIPELSYILLWLVTGCIAGVVNTLAGGGSNLTLPALMVMGMPADIANATNRVSVFLQSLVAFRGFKKYDKVDQDNLPGILVPTVIGAVAGSLMASYMPVWLLKPVLLGTMVMMALVILLKPSAVAPPEGTSVLSAKESRPALIALFAAGFYGGFIQAGVGFILLAAFAGALRYDLVRANALKVACTVAFTGIALVVFIVRDQIMWMPGLILAIGSMTGAHMAVKMAISLSQKTLKWFLFIMTLFACAAALWL